MAVGAFSSASISANGEQIVLIFAQPTPNTWLGPFVYNPANAPTISTTSFSYTGTTPGTTVRAIVTHTSITEVVNGVNLEVTVNLSESIFIGDISTSLSVTAAWVTDASGDTSGAATGVSVPNNSTLVYPNVIGQMTTVPFQRYTGTFNIEGVFAHRFWKGLKSIETYEVAVTDSAAFTQTKTSSAFTSIDRVGAHGTAPKYPGFRLSFDANNRGDAIRFASGVATVTVKGYPRIGVAAQIRQHVFTIYLDPSTNPSFPVQPVLTAYVNLTTGNDTTGVLDNPALPFATIVEAGKKIQDTHLAAGRGKKCDGGIIYLEPGNYTYGDATAALFSIDHWVTIKRSPTAAPGDSKFIARTGNSGFGTNLKKIKIEGIEANYNISQIQFGPYTATPSHQITLWTHDCTWKGMGGYVSYIPFSGLVGTFLKDEIVRFKILATGLYRTSGAGLLEAVCVVDRSSSPLFLIGLGSANPVSGDILEGQSSGATANSTSGQDQPNAFGNNTFLNVYATSCRIDNLTAAFYKIRLVLDCFVEDSTQDRFSGTFAVVNSHANLSGSFGWLHGDTWQSFIIGSNKSNIILWYLKDTNYNGNQGLVFSETVGNNDIAVVCCEISGKLAGVSATMELKWSDINNLLIVNTACLFNAGTLIKNDGVNSFVSVFKLTNLRMHGVVHERLSNTITAANWLPAKSYFKQDHTFITPAGIVGFNHTEGGAYATEYVNPTNSADFTPKSTASFLINRLAGDDLLLPTDIAGRNFTGAIGPREAGVDVGPLTAPTVEAGGGTLKLAWAPPPGGWIAPFTVEPIDIKKSPVVVIGAGGNANTVHTASVAVAPAINAGNLEITLNLHGYVYLGEAATVTGPVGYIVDNVGNQTALFNSVAVTNSSTKTQGTAYTRFVGKPVAAWAYRDQYPEIGPIVRMACDVVDNWAGVEWVEYVLSNPIFTPVDPDVTEINPTTFRITKKRFIDLWGYNKKADYWYLDVDISLNNIDENFRTITAVRAFTKDGVTHELIPGKLTPRILTVEKVKVIRFVDAAATGAGTGLTWTDAYTTVSAAEAAAGTTTDEMHVAPGTYDVNGLTFDQARTSTYLNWLKDETGPAGAGIVKFTVSSTTLNFKSFQMFKGIRFEMPDLPSVNFRLAGANHVGFDSCTFKFAGKVEDNLMPVNDCEHCWWINNLQDNGEQSPTFTPLSTGPTMDIIYACNDHTNAENNVTGNFTRILIERNVVINSAGADVPAGSHIDGYHCFGATTITGANWTAATKRITKTGGFTNLDLNSPIVSIYVNAGTGVTIANYRIKSIIDANTIELYTSISLTDITDSSVACRIRGLNRTGFTNEIPGVSNNAIIRYGDFHDNGIVGVTDYNFILQEGGTIDTAIYNNLYFCVIGDTPALHYTRGRLNNLQIAHNTFLTKDNDLAFGKGRITISCSEGGDPFDNVGIYFVNNIIKAIDFAVGINIAANDPALRTDKILIGPNVFINNDFDPATDGSTVLLSPTLAAIDLKDLATVGNYNFEPKLTSRAVKSVGFLTPRKTDVRFDFFGRAIDYTLSDAAVGAVQVTPAGEIPPEPPISPPVFPGMRTISSEIRTAIDTLNQRGRWAHLYDVVVDSTTTLRLTDYPKILTYNTINYTPYPIGQDEIPQTSKPENQTFTITVANIDRSIGGYLEAGKLLGNDVTINFVFVRDIDNSVVFGFFERYQILHAELDENNAAWAFEVGKYNLFSQQLPRTKWIDLRCEHVYKALGTCHYGRDEFQGVSQLDIKLGGDGDKKVQGWRALNFNPVGITKGDINITQAGFLTIEVAANTDVRYDMTAKTSPFLYRILNLSSVDVDDDFDIEISVVGNAGENGEGEGILITNNTDGATNWVYLIRKWIGGVSSIRGGAGVSNIEFTTFTSTSTNGFLRIQKIGNNFSFYHKATEAAAYGATVGSIVNANLSSTTVRMGLFCTTESAVRSTSLIAKWDYFKLVSGGFTTCDRTIAHCIQRENFRRFGGAPGILHGPILL
jgi:hypothetical protein